MLRQRASPFHQGVEAGDGKAFGSEALSRVAFGHFAEQNALCAPLTVVELPTLRDSSFHHPVERRCHPARVELIL